MEQPPLFISEAKVKEFLTWPLVYEACEQALRSVCKTKTTADQPTASQPARPIVIMNRRDGVAFSMVGYIDNYKLPSIDPQKTYDTLGHKLVTSFQGNESRPVPLPKILATISLYDTETGKLKTIVEATEITAWRTAAASLVSTKYLYFNRCENASEDKILAVIGCGVQGRIHAIGMCSTFPISQVHLLNRTNGKTEALAAELESLKGTFKNKNLKVVVEESVEECVKDADIVVTATFAETPFLFASMLKDNVHINAVGAGVNHHSEIDGSVYAKSKIYVDNWAGAESELKTLNYPIEGEVGEVINAVKPTPHHSYTIFHSMGMAVEDAVVAQLVNELYLKQNNQQ